MELEKQFDRAQIKRNNGQINEAVADFQRIREESLKADKKHLAADCLHMIGVAWKQAENFPQADNFLKLAKEEFESLEDSFLEGAVLRDLGVVALKQENYSQAANFLLESIKVLEKTSQQGHLGISKVKLGLVYAGEDQLDEAVRIIEEGIADIQNSPDRFFEMTGYLNLAEVQKQAGNMVQARESLKKAEQVLNEIGPDDQFKVRRRQIEDLRAKLETAT